MAVAAESAEPADDIARRIVKAAEMQRGLVVVLQDGDHGLVSRLKSIPGTLVQQLDVEDQWAGRLPYVDNLVNLIVGDTRCEMQDAGSEILRVLAPRGVAVVREKGNEAWLSRIPHPVSRIGGGYVTFAKPWPDTIDDWTHFLHGPDNNPVSADTQVGFPAGLQWIEAPLWTRDHDSAPSIFGLVSAKGRLFYILDEGPIGMIEKRLPPSHSLIARDAHNGVLLWKRRLPDWYPSHVQWGTTPVHLNRRLVAAEDRVYVTDGLHGPVVALDATTGEKLRSYAASENAAEILVDSDLLVAGIMPTSAKPGDEYPATRDQNFKGARLARYQSRGESLAVFDVGSERMLWSRSCPFIPTMTCSDGDRLVYATDQHLACVDLRTGKPIWQSPGSATKLIVHDSVVVTAKEVIRKRWTPGITVQAQSIEDGKILWKASGKTLPTFGNFFYIPPEMFIANGSVWIKASTSEDIVGLDLRTGETNQTVSTKGSFTPGHHVRCYPAKATEQFVIFNKRGMEFLDLSGRDGIKKHDWVRGACRLGVLPCNGMIYVPPNGCNCCVETYLRGFLTLNSSPPPEPIDDARRLERGPAYNTVASAPHTSASAEWPTFRADSARSSRTSGRVNAPFREGWRKTFGGAVSSATIAAGRVFVSEIDSQTVHALDVRSGESVWSFRAGGRVDSPPTLADGLAVFGAADGYIYCLSAAEGQVVWRFQAAPVDQRLVAFGQVESVWPCHGSVLIKQGVVYAAAGRSSYLNGGIVVYGLDLRAGKVLHRANVESQQPQDTTMQDTHNNWGALPDILVSDGEHIFMRNLKFDSQLNLLSSAYPIDEKNRSNQPRVMASAGFLDNTGNKRTFRAVSKSWVSRYSNLRTQQLATGDGVTYGCRIHFGRGWKSPRYHAGDGTLVFAQDHAALAELVAKTDMSETVILGNRGEWHFDIPRDSFRWQQPVPIYTQAAVLAGGQLLIAGRPDRTIDDAIAFAEGRATGELWVLSASDGEVLHHQTLAASPILDGMVVVDGRVFVNTTSNEIVCLQGAN